MTILIVEDEALAALSLATYLGSRGHRCIAVATMEEALAQDLEASPDLVLMDINLVGSGDGIETADRISRKRPVPIIFMTGYTDTETIRRANALQPMAVLEKPLSYRQLSGVIGKLGT